MGTTTNSQCVSVFDYILKHVKEKKITNGRLSTAFWTQIWQEFDLSSDIPKSLPQPAENAAEEIEEELLEAMELARARNLVERSPTALVRYLEKTGMLSKTALYGILCAVQIGPGFARAHATKLQVAVLQWFARRGGGALGMSGPGTRKLHSCAHVGVEFRLDPSRVLGPSASGRD